MTIITIGVNFETAPVEIRERLAFTETVLPEAMLTLNNHPNIQENMIISTCNRTEIYAEVNDLHKGRQSVNEFLCTWFQFTHEEINQYLYIHTDHAAVEHLFKVTCGLNSMILGETQILGQVRKTYLIAQENETIGPVFNQLVKQALTLAKKAHTETAINENAVSVSYAAVELVKKEGSTLIDKRILVIGAGKMGALAINHLIANGANDVTLINRTYERAGRLADKLNIQVQPIELLQEQLQTADIVISSTGAKEYIVTKDMIHPNKQTIYIDLAVPRDIDPYVHQNNQVSLYDIDDLEDMIHINMVERQKAANEIQMMIGYELVQFEQWMNMQKVTPTIAALREKALQIQAETMSSIENKMPDLSAREKKLLEKHTKSIMNQLIKDPILQLKQFSMDEQSSEKIALFKQIFSLEDEDEVNYVYEKV